MFVGICTIRHYSISLAIIKNVQVLRSLSYTNVIQVMNFTQFRSLFKSSPHVFTTIHLCYIKLTQFIHFGHFFTTRKTSQSKPFFYVVFISIHNPFLHHNYITNPYNNICIFSNSSFVSTNEFYVNEYFIWTQLFHYFFFLDCMAVPLFFHHNELFKKKNHVQFGLNPQARI